MINWISNCDFNNISKECLKDSFFMLYQVLIHTVTVFLSYKKLISLFFASVDSAKPMEWKKRIADNRQMIIAAKRQL